MTFGDLMANRKDDKSSTTQDEKFPSQYLRSSAEQIQKRNREIDFPLFHLF